jgi:hypothetical protein
VSFSVIASSAIPVSYQWKHDGVNLTESARITGVNTATLSIANVQATDEGAYTVALTNDAGTTNSASATLTVTDTSFRFVTDSLTLTNGVFYFQITGLPPSGHVVVQSSSNLIHWVSIRTNSTPTTVLEIADPVDSQPQRFYRAFTQY